MLISRKGRYSVRAVFTLASMQENSHRPIKLSLIAQTEKLPLYYIEQLFNKLRKENLITSVKGPGGGYLLSRPPENITILEILSSVGETDDLSECSREERYNKSCTKCHSRYIWETLDKKIKEYLNSITLHDILHKQSLKEFL